MSTDPTPEVKAFRYVESLGLNSVHEHALAARKELGDKILELHAAKARRRSLESLRTDLEMAVIEDEHRKHTDLSVAAMDRHLKVEFSNNGELREAKDDLIAVASDIDLLEFEVSLLETDIRIAAARLHELGGYFQFMAVLKQAETTRKTSETIDTDDPWRTQA